MLIDEIDKADIEFPNDLLLELDKMEFYCYETQETIKAKNRPIVIITSNNEKELPDAFLRRCLFHFIRFPDESQMKNIVDVHHPNLQQTLMDNAFRHFYKLRKVNGMKKKPSTSELIDWISLLLRDDLLKDEPKESGTNWSDGLPPHLGSLVKNEQDLALLERFLKT